MEGQQEATADMAAKRAEYNFYKKRLEIVTRMYHAKISYDDLIAFSKFTSPTIEHPEDTNQSDFYVANHHEILSEKLHRIESGDLLRSVVSMPPRHGKTFLSAEKFIAWYIGRNPSHQVIFATYGAEYAEDVGEKVRELIMSPAYQQVFPNMALARDSKSKKKMAVKFKGRKTGQLMFVGRGGALTGRGAHLLVIDDLLKDDSEADSPAERDKMWNWYTKTAYTRLMTGGKLTITMTRWHEDDLIGRLLSEDNPFYNRNIAKGFEVTNLSAITKDEDGKEKALWPEVKVNSTRLGFGLNYLRSVREQDPAGFEALYQGNPTPEDGDEFKAEMLVTYNRDELPPLSEMRFYGASDHASSMKERRDPSCLGVVGVDADDNIWVMPDLVWKQLPTDRQVEEMLDLADQYEPEIWWAENGHISQAMGPFLYKRMEERGVYLNVVEKTPIKDKVSRSASIRSRMSMGKVRFPLFASWWNDAKNEMLKFPRGSHDDFVDFLSWIGIGLRRQSAAKAPTRKDNIVELRPGTIQWVKQQTAWKDKKKARANKLGGM